jgi:hypothetical protein
LKVTAIIPDDLISDVKKHSKGKNLTDSLIKALREWVYLREIESLSESLAQEPLQFQDGYSASRIRKLSNK